MNAKDFRRLNFFSKLEYCKKVNIGNITLLDLFVHKANQISLTNYNVAIPEMHTLGEVIDNNYHKWGFFVRDLNSFTFKKCTILIYLFTSMGDSVYRYNNSGLEIRTPHTPTHIMEIIHEGTNEKIIYKGHFIEELLNIANLNIIPGKNTIGSIDYVKTINAYYDRVTGDL